MKRLLAKLKAFFRPRADIARDLRDEMSAHLEFEIEERIAGGMPPEQARVAARRDFGNSTRIVEDSGEVWRWAWLDQLQQDLVYAARTLWRSPGFTFSAIGVLGLGIGVNLSIIHIFNAAIFHRLSVRDAGSILSFERSGRFPYRMIEFFSEHNTRFSWVIAERTGGSVFLEDDPEPLRSAFISGNYFSALGVGPGKGRQLDERDAKTGAAPVVVLSHVYWARRFAADDGVIGRIVRFNGKPVEIIGIAPPNFTGLASLPASQQTALWFPMTTHPSLFAGSTVLESFGQRDTEMYAALKADVSLESANAELISLATELQRQYPDQIQMRAAEAATGRPVLALSFDFLVPMFLVTLLFMTVLITACANLGNLLLARGHAREREISIRLAVGAGASRIIRQLMVENLLLGLLGASAGLGVGYFAARGLLYVVQAPPDLTVVTDWKMVIAGGALAVFSAFVFGLAPARQAVRRKLSWSGPGNANRTRKVLVGVQVAASCFLLIVSSLITRGIQRQLAPDVRFDFENMVVIDPQIHTHNIAAPAARRTLEEMKSRLKLLPGVVNVTAAVSTPFSGRLFREARPGLPRISYNRVEPSYFAAMDLTLVRGRIFKTGESNVVVLSESAARAIWPGEDPIGKLLEVSRFSSDSIEIGRTHVRGEDQRIVAGIVKDSGSTPDSTVEGYMPLDDADLPKALLLLRTNTDPAGIMKDARAAASLPGFSASASLVRSALEQRSSRQQGLVLGVGTLGMTATLLAALGIFGLIAFTVAQRTREIGVRIALGAKRAHIFSALLAHYAPAMAAGALAGSLGAAAVGQALQNQIYGLQALDPLSYLVPLLAFTPVAIAAAVIPARRAFRVDPASALRCD